MVSVARTSRWQKTYSQKHTRSHWRVFEKVLANMLLSLEEPPGCPVLRAVAESFFLGLFHAGDRADGEEDRSSAVCRRGGRSCAAVCHGASTPSKRQMTNCTWQGKVKTASRRRVFIYMAGRLPGSQRAGAGAERRNRARSLRSADFVRALFISVEAPPDCAQVVA